MMFSAYPVLIGHFINDGIYSAEKAADRYLFGAISDRHELDIYPGPIGTNALFRSDTGEPFKGTLIIGLGSAEELNAYQLSLSVEKAISTYLLDLSGAQSDINEPIGITCLFIGANYGGMSLENSSRAILSGIDRGNKKTMIKLKNYRLKISRVEFLEIFEDKAISGYYSLHRLVSGNNDGMHLRMDNDYLQQVPGILQRIATEETDTWWQRLSVRIMPDSKNTGDKRLTFFSSTNNAREENQDSVTSLRDIAELIDAISIKKNWSFEKAKTVFELAIPNDFKESIKRNSPVLWILDEEAAAIPWEMLYTGGPQNRPISVSAEMLRQLSTSFYFQNNASTTANDMLIIGNPDLSKLSGYQSLLAAETEATDIAQLMSGVPSITTQPPLIHADAATITVALFSRNYKIIHFAGHGLFDPANPRNTGIVIGSDTSQEGPVIFSAAQFNQLPHIPELVFINSCYGGAINTSEHQRPDYKHKIAANIGTQLIAIGVKAVIVAGWDIDDDAARLFSTEFYKNMAQGNNFSQSVFFARKTIYEAFPYSNTWGAYQCYGQPYFSIQSPPVRQSSDDTYKLPQEAKNDLNNLLSGIDIAFRSEFDLQKELNRISAKIKNSGITDIGILEKEACAYLELNNREKALDLLENIFNMDQGDYNISTLEKYIDLTIKQLVYRIRNIHKQPGNQKKQKKDLFQKLEATLIQLQQLIALDDNSQRQLIAGSAYKRLAWVSSGLEKVRYLALCRDYYKGSFEISGLPYALQNWVSAELILHFALNNKQAKTFIEENNISVYAQIATLKSVFQRLINKTNKILATKKSNQSFWEESAILDIRLAEYLLQFEGYHKSGHKYQKGMVNLWKKSVAKYKKSRQIENLQLLQQLLKDYGEPELANNLRTLEESLILI